jgi:two-component sensor histidine kinase
MLLKSVFLIFLLGHLAVAQNFDLKIKEIDSLITYTQFNAAEKKVDSLYQHLNQKRFCKKYREEKVMLGLLQGLIQDRQYQHNKALSIFLDVLKEAEKNHLYRIACRAKIYIALNHQKAGNNDVAYIYLKEAEAMCKKYQLDDLYSTLYIRYAQTHRHFGLEKNPELSNQRKRIEKLGFHPSIDSSFYYTKKAMALAEKSNNENDLNDGYVIMGLLNSHYKKYEESSSYYLRSLAYWKKTNNFHTVANMYDNVASNFFKAGKFKEALMYSDSTLPYYENMFVHHKYYISKRRGKIYKELGRMDSAYHYLQLAYEDREMSHNEAELSTTMRLEEQYQDEKKESTIKSKNRQVLLITALLLVTTMGSLLIIRKNRQINKKNKTIDMQVVELSKALEQKKVLLSELQHRVKNNLQHVISILEIQKESVEFNTIDELIRGNQNRIHSMALLHKKLNVTENVNDVDLNLYITELAELVKQSYDNHKKQIYLHIKCEINTILIEKALPLGLIITELVSNSMKHAFKERAIGIIRIELTKDENSGQIKLHYTDNGEGFDFYKPSQKGLGQEIVRGLISQLDGIVERKGSNGFELTLSFKY